MTIDDTIRLLRTLAVLDGRLGAINDTDAKTRAVMWQRMIHDTITLAEAGAVCEAYYAHDQRWPITPGAINDAVMARRADDRRRSVVAQLQAAATPPTPEYLAAKAALFGGAK